MRRREQAAMLVFGIFLLKAALVSAQGTDTPPRIDNTGADTVYYCNGLVAVTPQISIENLTIDESSEGIKISIANYKRQEDTLLYQGTRFNADWVEYYGYLALTGAGSSEEYEQAIKQVYYQNLSKTPTLDVRSFSISLLDADYLPYTKHFYRYVKKRGILWTEARDSAANMDYYGLQGYLTTITSKQENDFIWSKIDGIGWIGATDSEAEGTWKWETGPESGTVFWQGNYNGYPVNGQYSYWNSGEPNNVQKSWGVDEDYAHVNSNPNTIPKSWNDLPNEGDKNSPNGYYFPEGFIVEFGGLDTTRELQLSASAVLAWSTKPMVEIDGYNELMCGENSQQIHLQSNQNISTILKPVNFNAKVEEETTLNPLIQLPSEEYGNYSFELEIINQHSCSWFDTIDVKYQHQPTAKFQMDTAKCKGYNLDINHTGTTVELAEFYWYSNDSVYVSGIDLDSVQIPLGYGIRNRSVGLRVNEQGCIAERSEEIYVTPKVDFGIESNREGCPPLEVLFWSESVEPIETYSWNFGDGSAASMKTPQHIYENTGTTNKSFNVSLSVVSTDGCENTGTLNDAVTVYPIPSIGFDFNEDECHSKSGIVQYAGSANERGTFLWDLSDFHAGEILQNPGTSAGPFEFLLTNRPQVEIGLQVVSEYGCTTESISELYRRKPVFDVPSEPVEGCPPVELSLDLTSSDTVDNVSYVWNLGDGKTSEGRWVESTYTIPDSTFDIEIVAKSLTTGCIDTLLLDKKVNVFPVPEASFDANPSMVLVSDPVVSFTNQSEGAINYKWNFDDLSPISRESDPVHSFYDMGFYNIVLTAFNEFGCVDSTFAEVSVAFDKLFPPNAFSPNAIREEDREFRIYSEGVVNEGYQLLIFNRWGEVIFESESQQSGWDGRMKNENFAPAGVYSWVITYFDFLGRKHQQQGTVTLLF